MRLKDRVAIVTGGGFGIGKAYSLGMAREGAKVVIADINDRGMEETTDAIGEQGGEALAVHTDVAIQESTEAMARVTMERFGRIDILVNNAALFTAVPLRNFEEIEVEEWDEVMAVNLRGAFLCVKAVVPHMKSRSYGKVINISSGSVLSGNPKRVHYVTSKAGLIGFTRSMALSLGEYNICVNTIMPGPIASEATLAAYGAEHYHQPPLNQALRRVGKPDDLVGTVIFLSSSDSDFITGATIVVSGGARMY